VILQQLKSHHSAGEPVTREFAALMESTFTRYGEIRDLFFEHLPQHLHQSELVSLVNVEIKNRLFEQAFCERIPDALKSVRRAIIRLEDRRAAQRDGNPAVNDLERLTAVAERLEALYQKHWEYYRYQSRLTEQDIVAFLLEVDRIAYDWDTYYEATASVGGLLEALHARPTPEDTAALHLTYHRDGAQHFAVGSVKSLMDFLEAGYKFICALYEIDPAERPLTLLQLDVADPVSLHLAVPAAAEPAYRRFMQYLFLKDLFKREALLRFVFEAVEKEAGNEKRLSQTVMNGFQKDVSAQLKQLPADGRFTISDRTFPDDEVGVMQEFVDFLEAQEINYDSLVKPGEKSKSGGRVRNRKKADKADTAEQKPADNAPSSETAPQAARPEEGKPPMESAQSEQGRSHIQVLTERAANEA